MVGHFLSSRAIGLSLFFRALSNTRKKTSTQKSVAVYCTRALALPDTNLFTVSVKEWRELQCVHSCIQHQLLLLRILYGPTGCPPALLGILPFPAFPPVLHSPGIECSRL